LLRLLEPCSVEATIVSAADCLSGQMELMARNAPPGTGFGGFHKHLGRRPFVAEQA
jgi:3'-5' exoribonuclease